MESDQYYWTVHLGEKNSFQDIKIGQYFKVFLLGLPFISHLDSDFQYTTQDLQDFQKH